MKPFDVRWKERDVARATRTIAQEKAKASNFYKG
jgi:hypothetical protein